MCVAFFASPSSAACQFERSSIQQQTYPSGRRTRGRRAAHPRLCIQTQRQCASPLPEATSCELLRWVDRWGRDEATRKCPGRIRWRGENRMSGSTVVGERSRNASRRRTAVSREGGNVQYGSDEGSCAGEGDLLEQQQRRRRWPSVLV